MSELISVQQVLEVAADFDQTGGVSFGLVAWELCVDEQRVLKAWKHAQADQLLKPAGRDSIGEHLWRLTPAGWAARHPGP